MLRCDMTALRHFNRLLLPLSGYFLAAVLGLGLLLTLVPRPCAAQANDPVGLAESLYEDAHYDEAIAQLTQGCRDTRVLDIVRCERILGLLYLALGQSKKAKWAFARLLLQEPKAELGDDYPPKVKRLFAAAKVTVDDLLGLSLESPQQSDGDDALLLEIRNPSIPLEAVKVFIAAPGTDEYQEIDLQLEGQVWAAEATMELDQHGGKTRYFLEVSSGGMTIPIGSPDRPLRVGLDLTGTGQAPGVANEGANAAVDGGDTIIGGLPDWAFWSIAGGAVAVLAGITIALASGGSSKPALVSVRINLID